MFYVEVISGLIVLFYPQEPIAKGDAASQMAEFWDIMRFYYHHWMLIAAQKKKRLFLKINNLHID